ncbi:hypothetical protein ACXRSW_00530 [Aeromonas dhakensis]|uniref:hypothetical protein n=1 Tax=Aeromonas dhakensis TaxID=196024 RepID=UPI0020B277E5|nr:hypothetical protein [Aeromonas dhakensis]CAD7506840.1 hypothetical protein KBAD11_20450 [Aeromonas dhakensis]CAD7510438.1 hypothetical protein KBAD03_10360 [Aeromonas dhakensis]CAD7520633.1 hypothetical protein KBAD14_KBAD14_20450 [Aeromonas dhakensis]CAD7520677.1 hypothetical protein KBAD10_20470 [Aeromonas dhakensis]CAD7525354.1 hypothetical protein KBAD05_20440 [Aeromonas dhakensis]
MKNLDKAITPELRHPVCCFLPTRYGKHANVETRMRCFLSVGHTNGLWIKGKGQNELLLSQINKLINRVL